MNFVPGQFRQIAIKISTHAADCLGGAEVCKSKCHLAFPSKHPMDGRPRYDPEPGRCCSRCNADYLDDEQRKIVWNELKIKSTEKGFLGPEGCRLPRTHRPTMCLLYACHTMEKHAPAAVGALYAAQLVTGYSNDWSQ